MDAGWVAAIASVVSAVVIAGAAIAAFVQIRHIRNANDIAIYLRLVERLDSQESHAVFAAVDRLPERLRDDPTMRVRLAQVGEVPEFDDIAALVRFLDNLTMLILAGGVSERYVLAQYGADAVHVWERIAEAVALRRAVFGPYFGAALEHLAMRSRAYIDSGRMQRLRAQMLRDPKMAGYTTRA